MTQKSNLGFVPILILLFLASVYFILKMSQQWEGFAWDFAINWTAAKGLRLGFSIYDRDVLRSLGQELIGPKMFYTFTDTFNGYIGPPSTVLLLLPFTFWSFSDAFVTYRSVLLVVFTAAVFLAGLALPEKDRVRGWMWGGLSLLTLDSVFVSVRLGQVDAWVMLGLAFSLWAARTHRWKLVGVGVALATLLKISPAILVVYCLLRKNWQVALSATITTIAVLVLAAMIGSPDDLRIYVLKVFPSLSITSISMENQSLVAWLGRIVLPQTDLVSYWIGLGRFSVLSVAAAFILLFAILKISHKQEINSLQLAVLILAALLIGPLTWDFYTAWATVALVQMADSRLWDRWSRAQRTVLLILLLLGGICLILPTVAFPATFFSKEYITAHWEIRLLTGIKVMGVMIWFGVGLVLLAMQARRNGEQVA